MEPLGRHEEHFWPSEPEAYGAGRARRGGVYEAFVPSPIAGLSFSFSDVASNAIGAASKALVRLTEDPPRIARLGSVAQNLLRSESVASSRIEGVAISHKRLARAEYEGIGRADGKAAEVLGNVEAMQRAISLAEGPAGFDVENIIGKRSSTDFGMDFGGGANFGTFYTELRYHYIWGPTVAEVGPIQPLPGVSSVRKANGQFLQFTFGFRF